MLFHKKKCWCLHSTWIFPTVKMNKYRNSRIRTIYFIQLTIPLFPIILGKYMQIYLFKWEKKKQALIMLFTKNSLRRTYMH